MQLPGGAVFASQCSRCSSSMQLHQLFGALLDDQAVEHSLDGELVSTNKKARVNIRLITALF